MDGGTVSTYREVEARVTRVVMSPSDAGNRARDESP